MYTSEEGEWECNMTSMEEGQTKNYMTRWKVKRKTHWFEYKKVWKIKSKLIGKHKLNYLRIEFQTVYVSIKKKKKKTVDIHLLLIDMQMSDHNWQARRIWLKSRRCGPCDHLIINTLDASSRLPMVAG